MKTKSSLTAMLLALLSTLSVQLSTLFAQGTAFTYQGRLNDGSGPATGIYDLRFTIYDSTINPGLVIAGPLTSSATPVTNGLFTVTLDFGPNIFTGPARWLDIAVRTNGAAIFAPLAPRQPLTPAPYSIFAGSAGTAATATSANAVPWLGLTGLPPSFADGVDNDTLYSAGAGLSLSGTTFSLNTAFTDARHWKLLGNAGTAPGTHFLGTTDNQPLELKANNQRALRLEPNATSPKLIGGHTGNFVDAAAVGATIGGGGTTGQTNKVTASYGAIGGGLGNTVNSLESVIGGGSGNTIQAPAFQSAIGGGHSNTVQAADRSTIAGGFANTIQDQAFRSFIGGGSDNRVATRADGSVIGGGYGNVAGTNAYRSFIGGGSDNRADAIWAVIGGGAANSIRTNADFSAIAGGNVNAIGNNADHSAISGGNANRVETAAHRSFIGGGSNNRADAPWAAISGGAGNVVQTNAGQATISGGNANLIQAGAGRAVISGGSENSVGTNAWHSAIGGGRLNRVLEGAEWATIPGGFENTAGGDFALAAGRRAKAMHDGSLVWADGTDADFASRAPNQFIIRAAGGVGIGTNNPTRQLEVAARGFADGVQLNANGQAAAFYIADGASERATLGLAAAPGHYSADAGAGDVTLRSFSTKLLLQNGAGNSALCISNNRVGIGTAAPTVALEVNGTVKASAFKVGSSAQVPNLNADLLDGLDSTAFWKLGGNAGTTPGAHFVGTTDNRPLELKANGQRALRLEPGGDSDDPDSLDDGAPNVIGGSAANSVASGVVGATIGGGGAVSYDGSSIGNSVNGHFGTVGGGFKNTSSGPGATVGGGSLNTSSANSATVGGGTGNSSSRVASTVGGGLLNQSSADYATVGGGSGNRSEALWAAIGGGQGNRIGGASDHATIAGGWDNVLQDNSRSAALGGGESNRIDTAWWATIAGGTRNAVEYSSTGGSIGGGAENLIGVFAGYGTISGGASNSIQTQAHYATIGGGASNAIAALAEGATVAGGVENVVQADATHATVGGGRFNWVGPDALHSTIAGGINNRIQDAAFDAAIGGGLSNTIEDQAHRATISGGGLNRISALTDGATVGGGERNTNSAHRATIGGGANNAVAALAEGATVGGGVENVVQTTATHATIGGGRENTIEINAHCSSIGGGRANTIETNANSSTIGGGYLNRIQPNDRNSTIGGGFLNWIQTNAAHSTIGGGYLNEILPNADFGTIPGGRENRATNYAFAAGHLAEAIHNGAFVWGDSTPVVIRSTADDQFTVRASGGTRFFSNSGSAGVQLASGGGSWSSISDRNAKTNVQPVNGSDILEKVAALPLATWNYKSQDAAIRHIGPMAQDFQAAFGVGENDTTITTIDADGVALAAIQGLNQKLEERLKEKDTRIAELEKRLETLERLLPAPAQTGGGQ